VVKISCTSSSFPSPFKGGRMGLSPNIFVASLSQSR
jgi:hypothetical protein